jgi:hypothetical protein
MRRWGVAVVGGRKLGMSRVPSTPYRRHVLFSVRLGSLLCLFQRSTLVYPISMRRRGSVQVLMQKDLTLAR